MNEFIYVYVSGWIDVYMYMWVYVCVYRLMDGCMNVYVGR